MTASLLLGLLMAAQGVVAPPLFLDDGADAASWRAVPSEGVGLELGCESGELRLDFDFGGGSGWAAAWRPLEMELPESFLLRIAMRGEAPTNTLEVKLVMAGEEGETVWWARRPAFELPRDGAVLELKRRHFSFAWGPERGRPLDRVARLEIAIVAGEGGAGTVWIDEITLEAQPAPAPPGPPTVSASAGDAALAVDGDPATAWAPPQGPAWLELDFGGARELGGLVLDWAPGHSAAAYVVERRLDGGGWRTLREVRGSNGGRDWLYLPDTEAAGLRLQVEDATGDVALRELSVEPLAFAADANAFFGQVAASFSRGLFPRYLTGEQVYWAVAGVDGGEGELLVGEDGAVESADRQLSVEPFLRSGGRLVTWADVTTEQSLVEGDLPIPVVTWRTAELDLELTVLAEGAPPSDRALVRYRVTNRRDVATVARLVLALRPLQVNPPQQFLNLPGGVGHAGRIAVDAAGVAVDGAAALSFLTEPQAFGATTFAGGEIAEHLVAGELPAATAVEDPDGWASAAAVFKLPLAAGGSNEVVVAMPLDVALAFDPADAGNPSEVFEAALHREVAGWCERLDRVTVELPPEGADLAATVRANLGYILVNRDGPAVQPGSRAYDRSWIRDGALTSAALIRLGHVDAAANFAEWFAGYQFASGRVPCCVDARGADPVPEHDSHGELVYLIAEVVRSSGDLDFARRMWPHVAAATTAIESLRAERRTAAEETPPRLRFWGLLPESISHEGYSDRPVHSYWDDVWGIRGLEDGARLAGRLGLDDDARRLGAAAAEMRREVLASMARVAVEEGIEYLPASADLADFDPTSTTVAVAPLGLAPWLPQTALEATFWRYLAESRQRAAGTTEWDAYTPYELRAIGTLVRLGWREEAWEMLRFFLADRRPAGWRQWAEVVGREPRAPRFVGDMPHTWCGSDFIRSALDLLAYEDGDRLVLAAGVPAEWTDPGERVAVSGLVTQFGPLRYQMVADPGRLVVTIDALRDPPPGGVLVSPPGLSDDSLATVNGRETTVADGAVAVRELPAVVVIGDRGRP
jgi:hypothetical protein